MKKCLLFFILLFACHQASAQLINADLFKLRHQWGYFDFARANTARFSMYMLRAQKRTMHYMNLARQNGEKFTFRYNQEACFGIINTVYFMFEIFMTSKLNFDHR